jgi:hypothetical protein
MNGILWGWLALPVGLVAAWLFDRRARRHGHRPGADPRRFSDEREGHASAMPPRANLGEGGVGGPPAGGPPGP